MKRPWSLRARLLAAVVVLLAVVCLVVGSVTTLALRSFLVEKLDAQVTSVTSRVYDARDGLPGDDDERPALVRGRGPLDFLNQPGLPVGTIGAHVVTGGPTDSGVITDGSPVQRVALTAEQQAAVTAVPADGTVQTRTVPGLGDYRLTAHTDGNGDVVVAGLPLAGVEDTVGRLVMLEIVVAGAGLVVAGIVGSVVVRRSLAPLRRVAATAGRVSALPLDRGDVELVERVPAADSDPRTEVGQVGLALNRMLGHVGAALVARHASEMRVRQFVADASHELRTPLASIRGYAEFAQLAGGTLPPDVSHALERVRSQTERMSELVDDLLLLARLDAGRPLADEPVDLTHLVVDAVGDARAAGPDHVWRLDLPDDPVEIAGDDSRLHQVVGNLLANARTHTPAGTTVTVGLTVRERPVPDAASPRPAAVLTVADDGPGIPPALLPDVFERFARAETSRTRDATGTPSTGLGLAIVAAVVEAHGGTVDVRSRPGSTVFEVTLPLTGARTPPADDARRGDHARRSDHVPVNG
jgi:two-component system OmpR family sensor kinase